MFGIYNRGFMKIFHVFCMVVFVSSCATRIGSKCPAPLEYRKKSVVSIMKNAKETVARPSEKKAVVFSVFGSKKRYTHGMLENIEIVKDLYPGWDTVVFLDEDTVPKEVVEEAKRRGAVVYVDKGYNHAAVRFFAADKDYDRFISRDADSRIYPREVAAVADWMKNDWAILHNMRDANNQVNPMLAGMWGAKVKPLKEKLRLHNNGEDNMEKLYNDFIGDKKAVYGDDELFLKDVVLKAVGEDYFLTHESFRCDAFKNSRGFPIPRGIAGVHIGGIRNFEE